MAKKYFKPYPGIKLIIKFLIRSSWLRRKCEGCQWACNNIQEMGMKSVLVATRKK